MQQYVIPLMIIVALPIGGHCDWSRGQSKLGQIKFGPIKSPVPTSSIISSKTHTGTHKAPKNIGNGWIDLDGKIDIRPVLEQIREIPEIVHLLRNMSDKIGSLDRDLIMEHVSPLISSVNDRVGSGIEDLHKAINDQFHALHYPIDSTVKQVSHISEFLEHQSKKPVQCELTKLERGFDAFAHTVEDMIDSVQQQIAAKMTKGEEVLSGMSGNHKILVEILRTLQGSTEKSKGVGNMSGGECSVCQKLDTAFQKHIKEHGNTINKLGVLVHNLPREIGALTKGDVGVGSIKKDIQSLMKADESIKGSLRQLVELIEAQSAKLERQFSQSQKIIIETQYTVAETAKTVQKTASSTEQAVKKIVQEATKAGKSVTRNCS